LAPNDASPGRDAREDENAPVPRAVGALDGSGVWVVTLCGRWVLGGPIPDTAILLPPDWESVRGLRFEVERLGDWDSTLIVSLLKLADAAQERGVPADLSALPAGARGLLHLARAVPERAAARQVGPRGLLARTGERTLVLIGKAEAVLGFVGDIVLAIGRLLAGRARMRLSDFALFVQQTGVEALGIVGLISVLVGLILAFVGSVQLAYFGAQIYVADAVAIGMVREMGALMTAIVMAGRTGAAYAAQLGSMQVNEEIDALRTLGLSPVDFLVLPRVLALVLMLPLLTLYSNALGILGGMAVGVGLFDIPVTQWIYQTRYAVGLADLGVGLFMSLAFGVIVAVAGCYQGLHSGRSAAAVGDAATRAVVTAIVGIVVANAIVTVVTTELGI
jgi:phospholipid/cholesterol/gamma-HCH transport system permease protein